MTLNDSERRSVRYFTEFSSFEVNVITFKRTWSLSNAVCFKHIKYLNTNTIIFVLLCTSLLYIKHTSLKLDSYSLRQQCSPSCKESVFWQYIIYDDILSNN